MKKGKKFLTVLGVTALAIAVGVGAYFAVVRHESKKHNLITLDTSDIPAPVTESDGEFDIQLSEMKMHYVVYGKEGYPLILVHGNGGSKNSLDEAARYLANDYKVYVIESRCHGQSSETDEITYDLMAKDIKEFCDALKLEKPYLIGHSDGGINALSVAANYPDLLGGFIACGANSKPETFKPYFTALVKIQDMGKHEKLNELMLTLPQFDKEKLSKITCPAYIVAGEYDIMWLNDTVFIHESIENSEIAIIKGGGHSSYMSHDGKQTYVLAKDFFSKLET